MKTESTNGSKERGRWRKGDRFDTKGWKYNCIQFISVDDNGWVYCDTDNHERPLQMWTVEQLAGTNINMHQRNRKKWIAGSAKYIWRH